MGGDHLQKLLPMFKYNHLFKILVVALALGMNNIQDDWIFSKFKILLYY